jgi:hypothetical protein
MVEIKRSNPGAFQDLEVKISDLGSTESKVGWFSSSVYPDGTPVAYIATIQEFGSPERKIPPRPFMRPTAIEKKQDWTELAKILARRVLEGTATAEDMMDLVAAKAEADVAKTIAEVYSPPLSPITLGARKYRQMGKEVTGATIGEIAQKMKDGTLDVSGVSTKPLNDTGRMIATLTHTMEKA